MSQFYGFGLGLRPLYYEEVLAKQSALVGWVEVISENYFSCLIEEKNNRPLHNLLKVREKYPVALHGVSLSLGSADPLDFDYLKSLKQLEGVVQPWIVSDHLCWTGVNGLQLHDLMPVPFTKESLQLICEKVQTVQDFLGRPIAIENVSSYLEFKDSEMPEWEFLSELTKRSGCGLLLDVNNIYVSSINHGWSAKNFIDSTPGKSIWQMHVAGHSKNTNNEGDPILVDTHDQPVCREVWELLRYAVQKFGLVNTMLERDGNFPAWSEIVNELQIGHQILYEKGRAENAKDKRITAEITKSDFTTLA